MPSIFDPLPVGKPVPVAPPPATTPPPAAEPQPRAPQPGISSTTPVAPKGATQEPLPGSGGIPATQRTTTPAAPAKPPGIVDAAAPAPAPVAPTGSAGTPQAPMSPYPDAPVERDINPVMGEVTRDQTVSGQLDDILTKGNPLLEAAKARAMQAANSRGLQNSSMAVQSGEEAIVNSALPIAQADAAAYQKQALVNQDISNQFLSMDKASDLDLKKAYEAFKQNNYMFDKDEKLKRYINDSGITSSEKIAALQAAASKAQTDASIRNTDANNAAAEIRNNNDIAGRLKDTGLRIEADTQRQINDFKQQDKVNILKLDADTFNSYATALNNISLAQLEPEAKAQAIANLNALYLGNPNAKFLNPDAFPKTTAAPPPGTTSPAPNTSPPGHGGDGGGDGGGGDGGGGGGGDGGGGPGE